MTTTELERTETEEERILAWRLEQLLQAGYAWGIAGGLARRPDVDLHRAADLLRRGCPQETARRILL